ncbi:MAG TPA: S16 family serine protease [Kineosporiaceae bacterium]|nr:S16 family serine protease [Kineosporiaceae bacterium]
MTSQASDPLPEYPQAAPPADAAVVSGSAMEGTPSDGGPPADGADSARDCGAQDPWGAVPGGPGGTPPGEPAGQVPAPEPGLSHNTAVLLVCGVATVLLFIAASLLPVPYAALKPGPAINTLGSENGKQLITITGHATYPTTGTLDLTTVTVSGGPGYRLTFWDVMTGVLDRSVAVVPVEQVFPSGQTPQQNQQQNQQEMAGSQEQATAAALSELSIMVPTTLTISGTDPQAPAAKVFRHGDVLVAVGGTKTPDLASVRDALQKVQPGQAVQVTVQRDGKDTSFPVTTRSAGGRTVLGILIDPTFHFPFQVKIQIDDVGGPSAGMMFALGIIDILTPGAMTGGQKIAGTGTIDSDGLVGPIGGIQEKMIGARAAGARWFLAPADDCKEVAGHVPDGLRVIRVSTLHEARTAVEAIAAGRTDALPTCPAP